MTMGLEPGMGVMHADQRGRDSLACDLMEAIRPKVDAYVLEFLQRRAFRKADFFETREGVCRLMPSITGELLRTRESWSNELASVTEFVADTLMQGTPTLLTESNRSAGRATQKERHQR